MEQILKDWQYVIKNCSVENTYKMAWSKAIFECLNISKKERITLREIASKMLKYYWNQTIYFNLNQGNNSQKPPLIISYVKNLIVEFQFQFGNKPISFERVESKIKIDYKKLENILLKDVSHRFLSVNGRSFKLYYLDKKDKSITISSHNIIQNYSAFLNDTIHNRWVEILEGLNASPRISKKLRIIDLGEIKRKSLNPYKKYLNLQGTNCFICGEDIKEDISIDHFIPFSYIFSDDLWNLVYVHKGCNSKKSNSIVKEEELIKLEKRNISLLQTLFENKIIDKNYFELKLAIEENTLRKFWFSFSN